MRITCSTTDEVFTDYRSYLLSNHWANTKAKFRLSPHSKKYCYCCKVLDMKDGSIHIHHRSYVNLGREATNDLVELCASCHSRVHQIARAKKIKWTDICFAVEYLKSEIARSTKKKGKRKTVKLLRVV